MRVLLTAILMVGSALAQGGMGPGPGTVHSTGGGGGGIAEVASQRATKSVGGNDSTTQAFPNNVTSGNLLVVGGAVWHSGTAPATVTITGCGVTWTTASHVHADDAQIRNFIAYGKAVSSAACTVTVDPAGTANDYGFAIDEFSGCNATPLDVDGSSGTSHGNDASPVDAITTVTANALIIGLVTPVNPTTITPSGSYTQIGESESGTNSQPFSLVFRIATTATSYNVDWTIGTSGAWEVLTMAFKP